MTQIPKEIAAAGNALISVTVYKTSPNQKAGIKVVQKGDGGVYVTAIAKGGLLDGTRVDVGDKLLSINGRRMRQGQDTRDFMKLISTANDKVIIVVKKDKGREKRTASKSPGRMKKLVERDAFRNKDGSFDFNINPKLEEFERSISKFEDDKEQLPITTKKLYPEQGAGLVLTKKDDMLFVSGIALDSIFTDTELEFGDRLVAVMDVNFMNYADERYAKTLLKRAKEEVNIVVEKGWNKLEKSERDAKHGMPRQESIIIQKKKGKITITKDFSNSRTSITKEVTTPMETLAEAETEVIPNKTSPAPEEANVGPLTFSPEEPTSRKTLSPSSPIKPEEPEKEEIITTAAKVVTPEGPSPNAPDKPEKEESTTPAKVVTPEAASSSVSMGTPSPSKSFTPDKESPSPANGNTPRKFLPPMPKESKKRISKTDVDAGDVVSRMLSKLDHERKGIKDRHRARLNQSSDDAGDDSNALGSPIVTPERRTSQTFPARKYSTTSPFSTPTSKMQKHQGGYLCISIRKHSERSPGIKLQRKDDTFILDKLPHDENRIPVGVEVLAINGDDNFGTVVKANQLIDSRKLEVELCVSFEGLIAIRASDDDDQPVIRRV